jgi:gliding motility-associated-like protein
VLNVLENDFDPDEGDIDTFSLAVQDTLPYWKAQHGTASPNGNGQVTYIPDPGYSGPDSFVYVICDNWAPQIACDTAIVRLNVIWNPKMMAVDDHYRTYMNNTIIMAVHSNDIDPDNALDLSSVQLLNDPENGNAITNTNGTITYIPLNNFTGKDSLSYRICNSASPPECDSAWVYINVVFNNDVVAVHDDTLTNAGEMVEIAVLENDFDPEDQLDSTSIAVSRVPGNGMVTVTENHTIWYEPQPGFAGLDSFIYRVCDLGFPKTCDTAMVRIRVIDNNIALVANPDKALTGENIAVNIGVIDNDFDTDGFIDTTSVTITADAKNGFITINTDGTITYEPATGFVGTDTFIYQLCDNGPVIACDTALVTITVVENMPPVAVNDIIDAVNGDGNITNIVLNDYDLDDGLDTSSVTIINPAGNGSLSIDENGLIIYIPDYCFFETDTFTYVIYDTQGNVSNEASVLINVSINPTIDADLDGVLDITEDLNNNGTPCDDDTDGDEIPNFMDDDDDGDVALTIYEDWNNNGDPTDDDTDGDGIPNYLDTDDDDDSVLSVNEDINGDGNPLNDDTDGNGLPNFIDPNDDGDFRMTIDELGDLDQNGVPDYLEIWNVYAVNDNVNSGIDLMVNIPVLENDSSQFDYSTLYILSDPENGMATIENDYTVSYQPDMQFTGIDSFLYTVCDYYQVCDTASVIINIDDILFFPELFTPNGDGVNDYYVITGIEKYPDNHFEVFNRWGNKVYEADGYYNEWNGWANVRFVIGNNELPVGVYYYIFRYNKTLEKAGALFLER